MASVTDCNQNSYAFLVMVSMWVWKFRVLSTVRPRSSATQSIYKVAILIYPHGNSDYCRLE